MILRRVIAHFRKQEWTAIAIDFVIVVVGVFIGIQVANWNAARLERENERVFIKTVREAILRDAEGMRGFISLLDDNAKFGARSIETMDAPAACRRSCWSEITDFFLASQWVNVIGDHAPYDEIQRTGLPRDRELKSVIVSYYGLQDQVASIAVELPEYRARVRSVIPASWQEHFWRNCFRTEGRRQYFDADCPSPASEEEARVVVDALRADGQLNDALNYWISTIAVIRASLVQQITEAENAVIAIDEHIKERS